MSFELVGEWGRFKRFAAEMKDKMPIAIKFGLERVGQKARRDLVMGIQSSAPGGQPYTPNHPFTIARKGSSKPLIHHGDLLNSINYHVISSNAVFVGIKRGAKRHGNLDTVNLAEIHEHGCVIRVTPKMRAYLHAQGLHLKKDTQYIRIPPRPTFAPVWEKEKDNYAKLMYETIIRMAVKL